MAKNFYRDQHNSDPGNNTFGSPWFYRFLERNGINTSLYNPQDALRLNAATEKSVGISASDASDADARAGGFTFAERLDRVEEEDAPTETAGERATDIARSIDPAISPEKENVPPGESGERDAQRAPCQTLGATTQDEVCVPSTDITPECTPRRSGRASKPSVRLQRV